jgi:hypothetical protein
MLLNTPWTLYVLDQSQRFGPIIGAATPSQQAQQQQLAAAAEASGPEKLYTVTDVEGFWRPERRLDGDWVWVDGAYDAEGAYHPGYWEPAAPWPAGMTWEPGFFDGQQWVEGFFRPPSRAGFVWVEARIEPETGVRHNGHWLPLEQRPGHVWSPGWFDGRQWNEGSWVTSAALAAGVPSDWAPAPGAEPDGGARVPEPDLAPAGELPLAVPVP